MLKTIIITWLLHSHFLKTPEIVVSHFILMREMRGSPSLRFTVNNGTRFPGTCRTPPPIFDISVLVFGTRRLYIRRPSTSSILSTGSRACRCRSQNIGRMRTLPAPILWTKPKPIATLDLNLKINSRVVCRLRPEDVGYEVKPESDPLVRISSRKLFILFDYVYVEKMTSICFSA